MNNKFEDKSGDTVRLRRPAPRVFTDPTGRSVWMGEVDVLEIELVQAVATDPYNSANLDEFNSKD
ncbi:MAG: hypothetical protein KJO35_04095 [Gammaproteobacteria bacterium]|nr:hypothetical protein [Gammaproteobacteria bacterium]